MNYKSKKRKTFIGAGLGLISFITSSFISMYFHLFEMGFPITFVTVDFEWGPPHDKVHWNLLFLAVNIIFWFIISFLITHVFYEIIYRKKNI